eukprot:m.931477 g.931477  ORF g.931477 m.931477 type:complete len:64 (-) comp23783_c1_seq1:65-256(-)
MPINCRLQVPVCRIGLCTAHASVQRDARGMGRANAPMLGIDMPKPPKFVQGTRSDRCIVNRGS